MVRTLLRHNKVFRPTLTLAVLLAATFASLDIYSDVVDRQLEVFDQETTIGTIAVTCLIAGPQNNIFFPSESFHKK